MIQKTELQKRLLPDSEHEMAALANQHNFEEQQSVWTRESKEWTRRQNVMYRSYRQKNHARTPVQKNPSLVDESIKKQLKRKRSCNEVVQLPPPPPILVRDEVFFCKLPDLEEVFGSNADVFDGLDVDPVGRGYPRFGRGGRLVFDRCHWKQLKKESIQLDHTTSTIFNILEMLSSLPYLLKYCIQLGNIAKYQVNFSLPQYGVSSVYAVEYSSHVFMSVLTHIYLQHLK